MSRLPLTPWSILSRAVAVSSVNPPSASSNFIRAWGPEVAKAILGSAVMALGICFFVAVGLGSDSIDVLLDGMSRTFGITLGQAQLIFITIMTVIAAAVNRKEVGVLSVLGGLAIGQFIDLFNIWVLPLELASQPIAVRVVALSAGQLLLSASYAILQTVRNGMNVTDAIVKKLAETPGGGYALWRTIYDGACLIAGMLIGGVFGVGTVLFVLVNGNLVKLFSRALEMVGFRHG